MMMYDDFYLNFTVVVVVNVNVIIHKQTLSFFNENKQILFISFLCYAKPLFFAF